MEQHCLILVLSSSPNKISLRNTASKFHEKLAGYQLIFFGMDYVLQKATTTHRYRYLHAILQDIALPKPSMDSSVSHRAGPFVPGDQPHMLCPMIMTSTSNTTTTNCCYQRLLFLPCLPAKPMPFIPLLPTSIPEERKRKKLKSKRRKKEERKASLCPPVVQQQQQLVYPRVFPEAPKTPAQSREEGGPHKGKKGPDDDDAYSAPRRRPRKSSSTQT